MVGGRGCEKHVDRIKHKMAGELEKSCQRSEYRIITFINCQKEKILKWSYVVVHLKPLLSEKKLYGMCTLHLSYSFLINKPPTIVFLDAICMI